MVAPIELYKQKYPELAQYSDYTLARNLYDTNIQDIGHEKTITRTKNQ